MLSILIPVYNFNVVTLVEDLHQQAIALNIAFEIRCYEDGSDKTFIAQNNILTSLDKVVYQVFEKNVGRSKIRNILAKDANYEWLLFMDCDSKTENKNYLKNYLQHLNRPKVIFGGRSYSENPPTNLNKTLRWRYGVAREVYSASVRNRLPYKFFMTNNFMIHQSLFEKVRFNEYFIGYGHEDTMFAIDLQQNHIAVEHIDNPLMHIGLENADEFLEKTQQGIKNLVLMIKNGWITPQNKLFQTYKTLEKFALKGLVRTMLQQLYPSINQNLTSHNPSVRKFDLYKLYHLLNEIKKMQGV